MQLIRRAHSNFHRQGLVGKGARTAVVKKNLNPKWNQRFDFQFSYKLSKFKFKVYASIPRARLCVERAHVCNAVRMIVCRYDYDEVTEHDLLGKVSVEIGQVSFAWRNRCTAARARRLATAVTNPFTSRACCAHVLYMHSSAHKVRPEEIACLCQRGSNTTQSQRGTNALPTRCRAVLAAAGHAFSGR